MAGNDSQGPRGCCSRKKVHSHSGNEDCCKFHRYDEIETTVFLGYAQGRGCEARLLRVDDREYGRTIFPVHVVVKDFCKDFCIGPANFQAIGETTQSFPTKIEALVHPLLKFLHLLVMLVGSKLFQTRVSNEGSRSLTPAHREPKCLQYAALALALIT
jgi:hypothetical protein